MTSAPPSAGALADASIDLVVSNLGINNFDDPDAVLRNCCGLAVRDR